jgi:hypothetical protein
MENSEIAFGFLLGFSVPLCVLCVKFLALALALALAFPPIFSSSPA